MEPAVLSLHVEDEVEETGRPLSEPAIAGVAIEIEKQNHGACRVVDARDAFEAPFASREASVLVVRVHAQRESAWPGRGNSASEARELPDHRGQGAKLAMISLTEKSAAAMHESAAP